MGNKSNKCMQSPAKRAKLDSVTKFSVNNVELCKTPYHKKEQLSDIAIRIFAKENLSYEYESGKTNYDINSCDGIKNSFIQAIFSAYCDHYNLELSVDDFWLMIAQGVATHINIDPEKYRNIFVLHGGKKELKINIDNIGIKPHCADNRDKWPIVINQFAGMVNKNVNVDFVSLLTNPFTTSSHVEQTVFNCTLMESMKSYFSYKCYLSCGIPEITLRGSGDDFRNILIRLDKLQALLPDIKWWFDSMRPHIHQIINTIEKKPDIDFWSKICHYIGGGSGMSMLSGWITDFVPYKYNERSNTYSRAIVRYEGAMMCNIQPMGIETCDFTRAITNTDVVLCVGDIELQMKLISGFIGVSQNPETLALRPVIGWIVAYNKYPISSDYSYLELWTNPDTNMDACGDCKTKYGSDLDKHRLTRVITPNDRKLKGVDTWHLIAKYIQCDFCKKQLIEDYNVKLSNFIDSLVGMSVNDAMNKFKSYYKWTNVIERHSDFTNMGYDPEGVTILFDPSTKLMIKGAIN
jgi:hypothetical protein